MKYSKNLGKSEGSSLGFLFYRIFMTIIAPFRLCSEVAKKVVMIGPAISDVLITATIINSVMFLIAALNGFLSHKFEIFAGFMPFLALGVSLGINVTLTLLSYKMPNMINLKSESNEVKSEDSPNYEEEETVDDLKVSLEKDVEDDDDEEVVMEDFLETDFVTRMQNLDSEISEIELETNMSHPTKETDSVYHLNKDEEMNDMLEMLKRRNLGKDVEVSDDEVLHNLSIDMDKLFGTDEEIEAQNALDEECDGIALMSVLEGNRRRAEEVGGGF